MDLFPSARIQPWFIFSYLPCAFASFSRHGPYWIQDLCSRRYISYWLNFPILARFICENLLNHLLWVKELNLVLWWPGADPLCPQPDSWIGLAIASINVTIEFGLSSFVLVPDFCCYSDTIFLAWDPFFNSFNLSSNIHVWAMVWSDWVRPVVYCLHDQHSSLILEITYSFLCSSILLMRIHAAVCFDSLHHWQKCCQQIFCCWHDNLAFAHCVT